MTPSAVTAAMIATAISKAKKAYSIEAVPRSSQPNSSKKRIHREGPLKRSGSSSGGGPGVTPEPPSQDGLLQLVETAVNVLVSFVPSVVMALMAATAMSAAIRPYSMAVAPTRRWRNG